MLSKSDAALLESPPAPLPHDTHESYLTRLGLLSRGFKFVELVKARGSSRHLPVPRALWPNTIAPLVLAGELRARLVSQFGAKGLRVFAFYRPQGGAGDSLHKTASAIDLDLLRSDYRLAGVFVRVAAELWRELEALPVGVGTYAPAGVLRTRRVHLDFGLRHRCWQGTGRNAHGTTTWAKRPAVLQVAPRQQPHPLGDDVEVAGDTARELEILEAAKRGGWPETPSSDDAVEPDRPVS